MADEGIDRLVARVHEPRGHMLTHLGHHHPREDVVMMAINTAGDGLDALVLQRGHEFRAGYSASLA